MQKDLYLRKHFYFYVSKIDGYHCIVQTEAESCMHACVYVEIAPIQKCLQGCGGEYDWLTFLAYQNGRLDSVIFQELGIFIFPPCCL